MFNANSRYYSLPLLEYARADGTIVRYASRRFLPDPDALAPIGSHVVTPGDRLDRIAAATLGDPEQWWRVADAERVTDPDVLTETPGTVLRITLPAGFGGATRG